MRVLFVGLGSIGQRHLRNLKRLVTDDVEILACRRMGHNLCIEDGRARRVDSLADHLGFTEVRDLSEALDARPEIVFVTNPSGDHLETAIEAARRGCHLFIEKPLADSLAGVDELSEFLSAIRERRTPSVSLDDGIESLRIVERIKQQLCEPSYAAV